MRWTRAFVLAWLAGASPLAQAAPGDCGRVTESGECSGATLSYCEDQNTANEHVVTVDCAAAVFPADIGGLCITVNDSYGADCAVPEAGRCVFTDEQDATVVAFCGGADPGCVIDEQSGDSACRSGIGPCAPAAAGEIFAPVCVDDVLQLACQEGQPLGLDCATLGGRCAAGACVDLPADAFCDGARRSCAAGLYCHAELQRCVDVDSSCAPETAAPFCVGDDLSYCATEHGLWQSFDCTTALGAGSAMTCGPAFPCVDDGSSGACDLVPDGCVGDAPGARCSVAQGYFCGAGLGCVMRLAPGGLLEEQCQVTAACDFGDTQRGCVGEVATFCLGDGARTVAEAAGFDCASLGSACVDDVAGPYCQGAEGARCDDPQIAPESPFRCAADLTCIVTSTELGVCQAITADAGVADRALPDVTAGDAGVDDTGGTGHDADAEPEPGPAPEGGCGCRGDSSTRGAGWVLALLGLGAALGARARRRVGA